MGAAYAARPIRDSDRCTGCAGTAALTARDPWGDPAGSLSLEVRVATVSDPSVLSLKFCK